MADTNNKEPVSREEFDELKGGVKDILAILTKGKGPTPEEVAEKKEVDKASANKYTSNAEWEDIAREVIGEAVDHTEIEYLKGGGLKFTVVIKEEFSNASREYLERHKVDRRSREVGAEGEAGVRVWCNMIRDNLKRPKNLSY